MRCLMPTSGARDILHVVSTLEGGGTEIALGRLLNAINCGAASHCVVTLRSGGTVASQLADHVPVVSLGLCGRKRSAGWALATMAARRDAVCIHARNTGTWADAVLAGLIRPRTRIILGFHGRDHDRPYSRRLRWLTRFALARGVHLTSVSMSGMTQLHDELGVPWDRMSYLPNSGPPSTRGDATSEIRQIVRQSLNCPEDAILFASVGSLSAIKRNDVAINAFAAASSRMSGLHMAVVGDGNCRAELESLAARRGVSRTVHFLGRRDDVSQLLAASDVFVHPSGYEGMSNAVLEAMAAGLPIIATRVGDNPQLLRGGLDGLLVQPNTPTELAQSMLTLAGTESVRRRLAAAARDRSRHFDFQKTVDQYDRFYESVIRESRNHALRAEPGSDTAPYTGFRAQPVFGD